MGRRGHTGDTRCSLAISFGLTAEFWLNLQSLSGSASANRKLEIHHRVAKLKLFEHVMLELSSFTARPCIPRFDPFDFSSCQSRMHSFVMVAPRRLINCLSSSSYPCLRTPDANVPHHRLMTHPGPPSRTRTPKLPRTRRFRSSRS